MKSRCGTGLQLRREAKAQLADSDTLLAEGLSRGALMLVGTAFDYRLRYAFAVTPPEELVAWRGASFLNRDASLGIGPAFLGGIAFAMPESDDGLSGELLQEFFDSLQQLLLTCSPPARRPNDDEESALARHCVVLGLLEQFGRGWANPDSPLVTSPPSTLDDLLGLAEEPVVQDLCALAQRLYETQSDLMERPFVLNPVFTGSLDVRGADADLIVDGCLLELKVSGNAEIRPEWLRQLLGYVLLDYDDQLGIREVGCYMARQGRLLRWPIDYFLDALMGADRADLPSVRDEFRQALRAAG